MFDWYQNVDMHTVHISENAIVPKTTVFLQLFLLGVSAYLTLNIEDNIFFN
jgi:hypothetical protein